MEDTTDIPIDPQLLEAGPSRSPSRRVSPPRVIIRQRFFDPPSPPREKPSEIEPVVEGVKASEDVALLLNISAAADSIPPPIPLPSTSNPSEETTFPTSTPHDPAAFATPMSSLVEQPTPRPHPTEVIPLPLARSPSPRPSTSDSAPKSAKGKRRRTQAGPSRRYSDEPDRPAHYMGEENTTIRCICGIDADDGFTIQCEGCFAWEHGMCFGYMDEESAPDKYYCELCDPRPVDPEMAKFTQLELLRAGAINEYIPPATVAITPRGGPSAKPKGRKRPRQTNPITDGEPDHQIAVGERGKDPSPGGQAVKPKRKVAANKPRSKASVHEPTPGPSAPPPVFKEPLPPVDFDDDYFTVEPWSLEFTPVQVNVVRGVVPRRRMAEFYHEWVDADVEETATSKRTLTNPSGLPSPTETGVLRLSPDHLFPSLDFDILAPPVPPVRLSGTDLARLSAPTHVEVIEDTPSFLPLNYAEVASSGVYARPALYGVFIDKAASPGSLLGEYLGEVIDAESYRRDLTNQYAGLGTTKPYVRSLGPPINLVIDARGYGSNMRFIRNSCHPNAVLRPILLHQDEQHRPTLKFGVFAAQNIARHEEITLGWEWDDQHVVHALRNAVLSNLAPSRDFGLSTMDIQKIAAKCDTVLTHLFGTFTSCACISPAACTIAQMRLLVEGKEPEVELNERGKVRVDFGRLIGAVRGWRRKELEMEDAKRWRLPGVFQRQEFVEGRVPGTRLEPGSEKEDLAMSGNRDVEMQETDEDETEDEVQDDVSMSSDNEDDRQPAHTPAPSSPLSPAISTTRPLAPASTYQTFASTEMGEDEEDDEDGNVSDATSATVPRSELSDAEPLTPIKPTSKRNKRVVSTKKASRSNGKRSPRASRRVPGQPYYNGDVGDTTDSDDPSEGSSRLSPPQSEHISTPSHSPSVTTKALPTVVSLKKVKDSLPVDWMGEFTFTNGSGSPKRNGIIDSNGSSVDVPPRKSRKSTKSEKDEPRAIVPDQVVAPMADATEAVSTDDEMEVDPVVPVEEPVREPTPREPTPRLATPPREPTPEPPKKVSFAEYMKTKKLKQDVPTPATEESSTIVVSPTEMTPMPNGIHDPAEVVVAHDAASVPAPQVQAPSISPPISTEGKMDAVEAGKVNLSDFLPSFKANGAPVTPATGNTALPAESPRPAATPSASFAPRADYFPPQAPSAQASSAFVPRSMSSSFAPRPSLTPSEESYSTSTPAFYPRQVSDSPAPPAFAPRVGEYPSITPPQPSVYLPDTPNGGIPPALPQRDLPPHTPSSIPNKPPPTGPKAPPTGPRGVFAPPAAIPSRPSESIMGRGGFGGSTRGTVMGRYGGRGGDRYDDRGFGGPRGGRGGFRGRGRGM